MIFLKIQPQTHDSIKDRLTDTETHIGRRVAKCAF